MKNIFDHAWLAAALLLGGMTASYGAGADWVVHEWGTFTSLQDEDGQAVGGINVDDEALPEFCHKVTGDFVQGPDGTLLTLGKGIALSHKDVTMRLETPVLYFHPPTDGEQSLRPTVSASFRGGWLTEFYPAATAVAPGLTNGYGALTSKTIGSLTWSDLSVGGDWRGPDSSNHVWTSPRDVRAANIQTENGEAEKFLFYRGVGHIDAPLQVSRDEARQELVLRSHLDTDTVGKDALPVRSLWLVDIRPDGRAAFRPLPAVTLRGTGAELARTPSYFKADEYTSANLPKLKEALFSALKGEGLFPDEAEALLNTWEVSYFKSAGMRLFFLVPRQWTDSYLPLKTSTPMVVDRVMVGRIELITPQERRAVQEIAKAVPEQGYKQYLALGRFRNALLLDEQQRRPSAELKAFNESHDVYYAPTAPIARAPSNPPTAANLP